MDDRVTTALAATDLFASLNKKSLQRLAQTVSIVEHPAGREIASEGRNGVSFHLVLDGTAEVSIHGESKRVLGPGDYFGEISLIDGEPRSATVVATSDLTTAALTSWMFRPLLDEVPGLSSALLLVMCKRLRAAEQHGALPTS